MPPYIPVEVAGDTVKVLGRSVVVGDNGLPRSIRSYFAAGDDTASARSPATCWPVRSRWSSESAEPEVTPWTGSVGRVVIRGPGAAVWEARSTAGPLTLHTQAEMEFDGTIEFRVTVGARRQTVVSDIGLEIPLAREVARYMMGLGFKGGRRPDTYDWTWATENNHDSAWIGDVNAGLQFTLKDDRYRAAAQHQLLPVQAARHAGFVGQRRQGRLPASRTARRLPGLVLQRAAGDREGGRHAQVRLPPDGDALQAHRSPRRTSATRYFHQYKPIDEVIANGANTINIHHATAINPWINYPFLTPAALKAYVDEAHAKGLKVKIYNTVRELSNRAPELFALRSLGTEILSAGPGGGFSWLQEHLGYNYIAAWFVPSTSRMPPSSTAACRAGTTTTSRDSTGSPATSASTASTSTTSPSIGRR